MVNRDRNRTSQLHALRLPIPCQPWPQIDLIIVNSFANYDSGLPCSGVLVMRRISVSFFSSAWGVPSQYTAYHVKESVHFPRDWTKHSTPSPDDHITLRVGLPQPSFSILENHLYEVSDPYHVRYGAHLSKEEVDKLVAPHPDSIAMVDKWLVSHGIAESDVTRSSAGDWVSINIPVSLAEKMLDTTYHVYQHIESGKTITRTTSYSLPRELHSHIDVIHPTTAFTSMYQLKPVSPIIEGDNFDQSNDVLNMSPIVDSASGSIVDASCNKNITIDCILQLYNAVGYNASATSGNSIAVTGYDEQFANKEDLKQFYSQQRPEAVNSSFNFISVQGGLNSQNRSEAGGEANIDTQFAFGVSFPTPGTFYSTATGTDVNDQPQEDLNEFILAHDNPPLVISTSYGGNEQDFPEALARRMCSQYAQLGARGVSVLFATADSGVGGNNGTCLSDASHNGTIFPPVFPTSCPFITAVGGTAGVPETATIRFGSGGGFSNYFSRPSYQDSAVSAYLKNLPNGTYEGLFNPNGRAYPDVAAQADRISIILSGMPLSVGGTSASSPIFAGIVALLNDARLRAGKPPLGFLNPLLYSKGITGLNDITVGNNPGCNTTGFNATTGWDPVTGLGTPNLAKLMEIVLSN